MDLPACADPTPADGKDDQRQQQPSVVEFEVPNEAEGGASNVAEDPEGCRRIIQPPMLQVLKGNRNARCARACFALYSGDTLDVAHEAEGTK